MNCPNCNYHKSKVRRIYQRKKTNDAMRTRICDKCKNQFSTLEKIAVLKGDKYDIKTGQLEEKHIC